ncbi:lytic transglycosylase domain-containing protein [Stakelama tenebrarum]|uniref:Lytic transglycosylase domain-containing protein n=1 Tax=Stakelama tenebrarum TaxID=2711215 RepID=A0A6G6Y196_9SPHN|nr:lytic transglycosylase domain-containing protein [Sphingosinithalassobacter tenebrarum]QIG78714.1 lytic transglycosylase domain-containing protein [Sphingosinithalassobacter tenebrarum]
MNIASVGNVTNVQKAIAHASRRTGVDFSYLLGQAQVESGMRPDARAPTSSASGLYQFIEQSWLGVVKQHGAEHGLGWAADSIRQNANGRFTVADGATRQAILDLRNDPQAASLMAAEHAADNKAALEGALDRPVTGTDLYMAHFLGLGGARNFLTAMDASPDRAGAAMFPAAARANRNIFYASNGQPRTLAQIYSRFSEKLDRGVAAVGGAGSASAPFAMPEQQLAGGGAVIYGNGAGAGEDAWVQTTLDRFGITPGNAAIPTAGGNSTTYPTNLRVDPLRPTPDTARLAYLMLASLGA